MTTTPASGPAPPYSLATRTAPPRAESTSTERSTTFSHVEDALRLDRAQLQREVLLWQRWVRYGIVAVAAAIIAAFAPRVTPTTWYALGIAAGVYIVLNTLVAALVHYVHWNWLRVTLQVLVLVADVAMITLLVYVSSTPAQYYRILVLGILIIQLTVFYFGRVLGVWATLLVLAGYAGGSLVLPPFLTGPRPLEPVVLFNAAVFLFVAWVLVATFGSFRERMNQFRAICKRIEMQDMSVGYAVDEDRLPDDLTLLGRSFNEMRGRIIELIGTDPLTECANRRSFEERLKREWRQAKRRDSSLALLAIDVDHFKEINDTHGHPVGDLVLHELADIMRATARETDAVGRLGGDEFLILLPDTGWQGAMTFAERLRRNVDEHVFTDGTKPIAITVSIGVALARGTDPISVENLLEEADRSLYRAKTAGRNRISA